jgi:hypothetical protein
MNKEYLKKIIEIRSELINMYNFLEGKSEPAAVVQQKYIAEELERIIPKIDNILRENNVIIR